MCATSGVSCGKTFETREMKRYEEFNNTIFVQTGRISGLDFSPNRKFKCVTGYGWDSIILA
jgi:hypothetical protein